MRAKGSAIVDGKSLRIVGFTLGAVTAVVVLIAGALVHTHFDGRLTVDDGSYQAVTLSSQRLVR